MSIAVKVHSNTLEAVEAMEHVFGKTRLGRSAKLKPFQARLNKLFDFERLYQVIGLKTA